MKRFIDLRDAETGWRFAWWCTVKDRFELHSGEMAWDTWEEFAEAFDPDEVEDRARNPDIERYRALCPEWVFQPVPEDVD